MVEIRYRDRLGNRLFQYALGRLIAEEKGLALRSDELPGLPRIAASLQGREVASPVQRLEGQRIDLEAILSGPDCRFVLDGWFQRKEYFLPYRDRMRGWISLDPRPEFGDVTMVHVRRNDYVTIGWALPFSFYDHALQLAGAEPGKVVISTDDPKDPFFRKFRPWGFRFLKESPERSLAALASCKRLVMSQSSFSWWAAFLGQHERVICPMPAFGVWSGKPGEHETDLIADSLFHPLPWDQADEPDDIERRYQKKRLFRRRVILGLNRRLPFQLPVPPP